MSTMLDKFSAMICFLAFRVYDPVQCRIREAIRFRVAFNPVSNRGVNPFSSGLHGASVIIFLRIVLLDHPGNYNPR